MADEWIVKTVRQVRARSIQKVVAALVASTP
jgi:hypothetical protein